MSNKDTGDTTEVTRREFLRGHWQLSEDTDAASSTDRQNSSDEETTTDAEQSSLPIRAKVARLTQLLVLFTIVVGTVAGATPTVEGTANGDSDAALDQRQQALALLHELKALDAKAEADIDPAVQRSVQSQLEQGNLSYRAGNYDRALGHYQTAAEQARTALKEGYTRRTTILLNSTAQYLTFLQQRGYRTPTTARLETRQEELVAGLDSADSLSAARDLHADTVELNDDLSSVPSTEIVRLVHSLQQGLAVPVIVVLLLIGVGAGIKVERRRQQAKSGDSVQIVSD